jgi:hypothetical protein
MSQQHEFEANVQESTGLYESVSLMRESADEEESLAPLQNVTESVYHEPQKISVSFDSRFMAALLSKIILLVVAGLNLVIARQSIPLLFFGYLTRYESLLLLLQGLFPLLLALVLGVLVFWLNLLTGRTFNANVTRDGKLTLSKPLSILQKMSLELFSLLSVIFLLLDVYIYLHYSSLYSYNFGIVGLLLAFCSTLTAVILCCLTLLVSWLSYLRRR